MAELCSQLPLTTRRILAGFFAAAGIAYGALLVATYLKSTAPSSLGPDLGELSRLLFRAARPAGPMERRLEASDTPLGTGPLISGGGTNGASMRFAFAGRSGDGSHSLNDKYLNDEYLNDQELAEREGERLALLDWIRSGASQAAYEADDYAVTHLAAGTPVTAALVRGVAPQRVRIRSLINERCVTCHHDDGDDTARLVPFDSYTSIARYLTPETNADGGRAWLLATLVSLFPLAALTGLAFAFTRRPLVVRRGFLSVTIAALAILSACWLAGTVLAPVLLVAFAVAVFCIMVQWLATIDGLLSGPS